MTNSDHCMWPTSTITNAHRYNIRIYIYVTSPDRYICMGINTNILYPICQVICHISAINTVRYCSIMFFNTVNFIYFCQ